MGDGSMKNKELSSSAIHRLMEKAGAARVGEDAVDELRAILEEVAVKLGREAWEIANYAGRKTVKASDVRLASKRLLRE
jgi:histone H3/H4